jgi:hypothetical protein
VALPQPSRGKGARWESDLIFAIIIYVRFHLHTVFSFFFFFYL